MTDRWIRKRKFCDLSEEDLEAAASVTGPKHCRTLNMRLKLHTEFLRRGRFMLPAVTIGYPPLVQDTPSLLYYFDMFHMMPEPADYVWNIEYLVAKALRDEPAAVKTMKDKCQYDLVYAAKAVRGRAVEGLRVSCLRTKNVPLDVQNVIEKFLA